MEDWPYSGTDFHGDLDMPHLEGEDCDDGGRKQIILLFVFLLLLLFFRYTFHDILIL